MTEPAPIAGDAASSRPVAQSPALGILLRVLAMALLAMLAAIVKACAERGVPVLEIIFFRNAFAFIPVMLYIWRTSGFGVLRTRRPGAHLTRSAVGLTGMICGFTAVSLLPLTQSTAISFSAPLFMVALSALILKEPVGLQRWAAVAVGFVGVLIMVHPDPRQFVGVGVLFAIAAAVLGGCSLRGGSGTILGIVIGTALIQLLRNMINLVDWIPKNIEYAVIGGVILAGAIGDEIAKRIVNRHRGSASREG